MTTKYMSHRPPPPPPPPILEQEGQVVGYPLDPQVLYGVNCKDVASCFQKGE